MYVYALFDNETAELVIIKFLHAAVDKLLDVYLHSFQSPKVQASAKRGILCAYEVIFSEDVKAYYQNSPISVTIKDFNQQVDGSSAGLAYAVAFAAALSDRKTISAPCKNYEKIAATGELDNSGKVIKIKNIKQKIIAAINENINLMLYPSQNYDELNYHCQTDPDFEALIKKSGIILKHVSTLKQAFCELGLFSHPTICINPISASDGSILTLEVNLQNNILWDINSFSLSIKVDKNLMLDNNLKNIFSNSNQNIKYSINKDNTLIVSFNTENDISNVLNKNTQLLELRFLSIDSVNSENIFDVKFEKAHCTINSYPYEGCGGIILKSNPISYDNNSLCGIQCTQKNKISNFISSNKKLFLSGILFLFLASIICISYLLGNVKKTVNVAITPTNAFSSHSSPNTTPNPTFAATSSPSPTLATLTTSLTTPQNSTTPTSQNSPTPTLKNPITPTPIKTTSAYPTPTENKITNTSVFTPLSDLPTLVLHNLDDFASWHKKDLNSYSRLSSEEGHLTDKVVRIDYEIKENGNVTIVTKPEVFNIPNNKYKKLSFYYKCTSIESRTDVVNIFINSMPIKLGTTQEISKNNDWNFKEIPISNFGDLKSFEIFIGCIPDGTPPDILNKGSFMICNFKLYQ